MLTAEPTAGSVRRSLAHLGAIVVALLVAAPGAAGAATFGDGDVLGPGVNPKIAVNGAGDAVAVWQRPRRSPGEVIAAVRSRNGEWSTPSTIGTTGPREHKWGVSVDVAIDQRGGAVIAWSQIRRVQPRRESVMTVRRERDGHWSAAQVLASFSSPHAEVAVGTSGRGLRPRVMLDADGGGVAVWARVLTPEQELPPGHETYVVDAATMSADGRWSPPRTLGQTNGRPGLDVAPTGDAVVLWTAHTWKPNGARTSASVLAATRPAGGQWSPPAVLVEDHVERANGYVSPPDTLSGVQGAVERDGRVTATWKRDYSLQATTRTPTGPWSAPVTLDQRVEFRSPMLLGADSRGEITAVWLAQPIQDNNDVALRAATRNVQGDWYAPTAAFARASDTRLTDAAISTGGRVIALVERDIYTRGPGPGNVFRHIEVDAYVRTPGRLWSRAQVLSRPEGRGPRSRCESGHIALADDGRGVAVWVCDAGTGHVPQVMSATVAPP